MGKKRKKKKTKNTRKGAISDGEQNTKTGNQENKTEWKNFVWNILLLFVGAIIGVVCTGLYKELFPEKPELDYVEINRPRVEPVLRLVIGKCSDPHTACKPGQEISYKISFMFFNKGKLTADNVRVAYKALDFISVSPNPVNPMNIAPNIGVDYDPPGLALGVPETHYLTLTLYLHYSSTIGGESIGFKSMYRFIVPTEGISTGEFTYASSRHGTGMYDLREISKELSIPETGGYMPHPREIRRQDRSHTSP